MPLLVIVELGHLYLLFLIEISSVALGGRVLSVSDDFFAEAYHLLLVEVSPASSESCRVI